MRGDFFWFLLFWRHHRAVGRVLGFIVFGALLAGIVYAAIILKAVLERMH